MFIQDTVFVLDTEAVCDILKSSEIGIYFDMSEPRQKPPAPIRAPRIIGGAVPVSAMDFRPRARFRCAWRVFFIDAGTMRETTGNHAETNGVECTRAGLGLER